MVEGEEGLTTGGKKGCFRYQKQRRLTHPVRPTMTRSPFSVPPSSRVSTTETMDGFAALTAGCFPVWIISICQEYNRVSTSRHNELESFVPDFLLAAISFRFEMGGSIICPFKTFIFMDLCLYAFGGVLSTASENPFQSSGLERCITATRCLSLHCIDPIIGAIGGGCNSARQTVGEQVLQTGGHHEPRRSVPSMKKLHAKTF